MAIRNLNPDGDLVVDVVLKNGQTFENCDIPQHPFGDKETYFGFYVENDLMIYPLTEIHSVTMRERIQDN